MHRQITLQNTSKARRDSRSRSNHSRKVQLESSQTQLPFKSRNVGNNTTQMDRKEKNCEKIGN